MPTVAANGLQVHYEVQGSGPPVLLVSGLVGGADFWDPVMPALCARYTVIRYDQRGTGKTSRPEGVCSVELLAEDALAFMDALGLDRPSFIGHSTGGAIGQVIAALHPERIDRLVLYASWAAPLPQLNIIMDMRRKLLLAEGLAGYHFSSSVFVLPPRFICEQWEAMERRAAQRIETSSTVETILARIDAVVKFDGRQYLGRIGAPTLVLVAQDDILTPPLASTVLAEGIAGAVMMVLDYGAHSPVLCNREAFVDAVACFLGEAHMAEELQSDR